MEITYKARSYTIDRIEQETEEAIAARAWFIIKALDPDTSIPNNIYSFDEAVLLSKYWYYSRVYDCKYKPEIMKQVETIEKTYKS